MVENANDVWSYRKDESVELTEAQQDPGILNWGGFSGRKRRQEEEGPCAAGCAFGRANGGITGTRAEQS